MVINTHTVTLCRQKNCLKKLTLFAVIATKSVDIVFKEIIDSIKEVNQAYVKS